MNSSLGIKWTGLQSARLGFPFSGTVAHMFKDYRGKWRVRCTVDGRSYGETPAFDTARAAYKFAHRVARAPMVISI